MRNQYPDPSERDLAWRGYSTQAMLPSFAICVVLSLILLVGDWFFDDMRGLWQKMGAWLFVGVTVLIWIVQLVRWAYRCTTYVYRLTECHLYVDRGFLYPQVPRIELALVERLSHGRGWFGAGWVLITMRDGRRERVSGLARAQEFAKLVENQLRETQKSPQKSAEGKQLA